MKEIKLEVGQVWQVPDKKWIKVREIQEIYYGSLHKQFYIKYRQLGLFYADAITRKAFLRWIHRNKLEKPIGICNFKTGKARVVK